MKRPEMWLKIGALAAAALTGGSTALAVVLRRRRGGGDEGASTPRPEEYTDADAWPI